MMMQLITFCLCAIGLGFFTHRIYGLAKLLWRLGTTRKDARPVTLPASFPGRQLLDLK